MKSLFAMTILSISREHRIPSNHVPLRHRVEHLPGIFQAAKLPIHVDELGGDDEIGPEISTGKNGMNLDPRRERVEASAHGEDAEERDAVRLDARGDHLSEEGESFEAAGMVGEGADDGGPRDGIVVRHAVEDDPGVLGAVEGAIHLEEAASQGKIGVMAGHEDLGVKEHAVEEGPGFGADPEHGGEGDGVGVEGAGEARAEVEQGRLPSPSLSFFPSLQQLQLR
jgi:hypothetical protein